MGEVLSLMDECCAFRESAIVDAIARPMAMHEVSIALLR